MAKTMNRRTTLWLRHVLDSVLLIIFAGISSALLIHLLYPLGRGAVHTAVGRAFIWHGAAAPIAFVMFFVFVAGVAAHYLLSAVWALRYLPTHLGLIARCWAGGILCIAVLWWTRFAGLSLYTAGEVMLCAVAYTVLLALGLSVGWLVARALHRRRTADDAQPRLMTEGPDAGGATHFRAWLTDDLPIRSAQESLVPSHLHTAGRVLKRLLTPAEGERTPSCNVALVGGYGSGKTSLCNLVRSEYEAGRPDHAAWPSLLFCRFEAWRYLTPQAALKGLIDAAANRILEETDECCLWTLGELYVHAARESGLGWAKAIAMLLGGNLEPGALITRLGELLCRLDRRLVVFVDDLDRIEATSADQQQAVVRALNQFQDAGNVQYVIAVGPAHWASPDSAARQPLLDLLKLTRFQELVPDLAQNEALAVVKELRDEAKSDNSMCYPWVAREGEDPLMVDKWGPFLIFRRWGYAEVLLEFLMTPRQLKQALRETRTAWGTGLDGEINWYHLLLAHALKVAEPRLFEWILRDSNTFIISKVGLGLDKDAQGEQEAKRLQDRLRATLQVESEDRYTAVVQALRLLFPVFAKKIGEDQGAEVEPWMQGLATSFDNSQPYLHRFSAGRVPEGDLRDRPALEYIRQVLENGFDPKVFEDRYLGSLDKLTGPLNKVVQFGRFLGGTNVLAVCDTILQWAACPESIRVWPDPRDFYPDMCRDVYRLLNGGEAPGLPDWLVEKVAQLGRQNPLLAVRVVPRLVAVEYGSAVVGHEKANELRRLLAETVAEEFVEGIRPLGPAVEAYPFALFHIVMLLAEDHPDYGGLRPALTRKLVDEADQPGNDVLKREIVLALVAQSKCPVMKGPVPPEAYKFAYDKDLNEKRFDMPVLLPVLKKWHAEGVADPLAQRVLRELAKEYGFEREMGSGSV